ncbi:hypothetical protein [Rubrivirga sp. IMCC45206]|uniref:hypothetical protein n=1 Tax=Rubrivirga sp. IMCC45206 TaxID=3391614 RepID=UPI003990015C
MTDAPPTPPTPRSGSATSAPPPPPSTDPPRRAWTILGRLAQAVREQNWFAVVLELAIVVLGVVIGFQVTAWGQAQTDAAREQTYLRQLTADLAETERLVAAEDSVRFARTLPAARKLLRSFGYEPKPPADSILTWFPDAWRFGFLRPVLGTSNALVSSGTIDLIRDDSLRSAIVAYLDLNEELMEEQRLQRDIVEAAGQRITQRVDLSEYAFATASDSAREARSRRPNYVGLYPTGDWVSPMPLDADAFYADPTMYTSAWSLSLELSHIEGTHRRMRESAAALRQRIEAQVER